MNYTRKSFSVGVGSDAYRDGYERIFGARKAEPITLTAESSDHAAAMVANPQPPNAAFRRTSRRKGDR